MSDRFSSFFYILRQLLFALPGLGFLGGMAQPHEPFHRRYGTSDGLPNETLYHLLVDRTGLLWIGTEQGLVTYNGIHFRQIPVKNAAIRPVTSLAQSADGRIWCRDFSKTVYEVVRDTLVAYAPADSLLRTWPPLIETAVAGNTLWLCSPGNVASIDLISGKYTDWTQTLNIRQQELFEIQAVGSQVYVLSRLGLHRISPQGDVAFGAVPTQFDGGKLVTSFVSNDWRLAMVEGKPLLVPKGGLLQAIYGGFLENSVYKIMVDMPREVSVYRPRMALGALWVCSNRGVWRQTLTPGRPAEGFFPHYRVSDITSDAQGNTWIATLDHGLVYVPNLRLQVAAPNSSLTRLAVLPDGNVCAGTRDGNLLFFSPGCDSLRTVFTGIRDDITFLLPSPDGKRIYSTYGWYTSGQRAFSLIAPPSTPLQLAKDVVFTSNGLLAATSWDARYLPPSGNTQAATTIRKGRSRAVALLADGTACVAYADQLALHLPDGSTQVLPDANGKPVIAYDLLVAGDTLWAATTEQGVLAWVHRRLLPLADWQRQLAHRGCSRLFRSGGDLWVVCEGSLLRIALTAGTMQDFSGALGLGATRVSDVVCHAGRIWLAMARGLLHLPEGAASTYTQPRLSLPVAWRNGQWFTPRQGQALAPETGQLRLHLQPIHYTNGGALRIYSRLVGRDTDWHLLAPGQSEVEYLSLPPGTYTWQIRATLAGQAPVMSEWQFRVLPAWWQTIWFTGTLVLFALALVWLVVRWQIGRIRRQEAVRQALVESQLTALRAQMNPHFMYNVLNSVQGFIYENKKGEASEYLGLFSDLMRKTLDNSSRQYVTIQEEWEALQLYASLEQARFEQDTTFDFSLSPEVDPLREIPSMLIQPLIENSIKHGLMHKRGLKHLHVSIVQQADRSLLVTVADNGIGRTASRELNARRSKRSASFATHAIDARIALLNRSLPRPITLTFTDNHTADGQPTGTTATLQLP